MTAESSSIKVLIVDDHPVVREGLSALICSRPDMSVVALASSGEEAVEQHAQHGPDVTLMDLRMPGKGGIHALEEILRSSPEARIIVLTTFDTEEDIYLGLRAGAKAFLLKDSPGSDIVDAIRAVNDGEARIPAAIGAKLARRMSSPELTSREREVLKLMAGGNSNQQIGASLYIAEGTVKAHVNNILTKMRVNDRTQAVTHALRRGLVQLD